MAVELGVSQQVYSNLEKGKTDRVKPEFLEYVQKNIVNDGATTPKTDTNKEDNLTTFTDLSALINANVDLSSANKTLAEANLVLSKMLSSSGPQQTTLAVETMKHRILELLSTLRLQDGKYQSSEEAHAILNRLYADIESRT